MIEVFKIESLSEALDIECLPYDESTYPYPIRLTYILQCTSRPKLIKIGRSYDLYQRVKTINRQTLKWEGIAFDLKFVIRSNPVLENSFKRELYNFNCPLDPRIDGSNEFYNLTNYRWKRLNTMVKKVLERELHT